MVESIRGGGKEKSGPSVLELLGMEGTGLLAYDTPRDMVTFARDLGKVRAVFKKVEVEGHLENVLKAKLMNNLIPEYTELAIYAEAMESKAIVDDLADVLYAGTKLSLAAFLDQIKKEVGAKGKRTTENEVGTSSSDKRTVEELASRLRAMSVATRSLQTTPAASR